jgi:hypothetical protein
MRVQANSVLGLSAMVAKIPSVNAILLGIVECRVDKSRFQNSMRREVVRFRNITRNGLYHYKPEQPDQDHIGTDIG